MMLTLPQHGPLNFINISSDNLSIPVLPGAETFYYENDFGTIIIQQYRSDNFQLRYCVFNLIKKVSFLISEETSLLKNKLSLKGAFGIKTHHKSKVQLKEGQYLVYPVHNKPVSIHFDKGNQYQIFDSSFSDEQVIQLFQVFPSLKEFVNGDISQSEMKRIETPHPVTAEMKKIIQDLLRCPYDENLRKLYFENKVNDFLFEILAQNFQHSPAVNVKEQKETNAILQARELILSDISKHISIEQLSKKVQLNRFKLKTGFKKEFGTGIFECLMLARMEKAKQLLIETDKPIKEIAALSGFDYLTNFITSFRKHFGKTPSEIRNK